MRAEQSNNNVVMIFFFQFISFHGKNKINIDFCEFCVFGFCYFCCCCLYLSNNHMKLFDMHLTLWTQYVLQLCTCR